MNKETLRELVGYDIDSFSDEILNVMNMEVMSEVAAEVTNDQIIANGYEASGTGSITITTSAKGALTFLGGCFDTEENNIQDASTPTRTNIAYVGNKVWFIYKFTNNTGNTVNKVRFTDTIPDNFKVVKKDGKGVAAYKIGDGAKTDLDVDEAGTTISSPLASDSTDADSGLGTLIISDGESLMVWIEVEVVKVEPTA